MGISAVKGKSTTICRDSANITAFLPHRPQFGLILKRYRYEWNARLPPSSLRHVSVPSYSKLNFMLELSMVLYVIEFCRDSNTTRERERDVEDWMNEHECVLQDAANGVTLFTRNFSSQSRYIEYTLAIPRMRILIRDDGYWSRTRESSRAKIFATTLTTTPTNPPSFRIPTSLQRRYQRKSVARARARRGSIFIIRNRLLS